MDLHARSCVDPGLCIITALPDELLKHVLGMLSAPSLVQLMRTSSTCAHVVRAADSMWDALAAVEFAHGESASRERGSEHASSSSDLSDLMSRASLEDEPDTSGGAESGGVDGAVWLALGATPTLSLSGGLPNFARLHAVREQLRAHLHVIEADISQLPMPVDVIAVPSNEWLENPGFGALQAVYRAAGPALVAHIRREYRHVSRHGAAGAAVVQAGEVVVTPSFGTLKAKWLAHCVGINWFGAYQNGSERVQKLHEQARLVERVFEAALERGATSLAIPAISTGARRFPPDLVAAIIMMAAKRTLLGHGGGQMMHVYCVSFGPVPTAHAFEREKAAVLSRLVVESPDSATARWPL